MNVLGPSPELPEAFSLTDAFLSLLKGKNEYLRTSLVQAPLIPDTSVDGFDSLLQASLVFEKSQADTDDKPTPTLLTACSHGLLDRRVESGLLGNRL